MVKLILFGANGKMGQVLSKILIDDLDFQIIAGVSHTTGANYYPVYHDPFAIKELGNLIIDFSHPSYLETLLAFALTKKLPLLIATTGYNAQQLAVINDAAKQIPIMLSANMSLGINILNHILKQYQDILSDFDIEIIEKHHHNKIDAPSGSALLLANTLNVNKDHELTYGRSGNSKRQNKEIGIHSIRGGTIVGEHSVLFAGNDELMEFKHTALSKEIFAYGAIKAGKFLINQPKGFYTMDDIFK